MQITNVIGNFSYSKPLAEVAEIIEKRFKGKVIMTSHFCVRHQAYTKKQLEEMEVDISKSDIVFLAMVFDEAVLRIVEKYSKEGKTFLITASVGEGMRLARIGKFCVGDVITSFADSKVAKVFKLLKGLSGKSSSMEVRRLLTMADSILKVLRFGKWKDAYNYVQAWKYFFHGGRDNILNMFLLILSEYHGFSTPYDPPTEIPSFYIAHPRADKIFTSMEDYLKWYDLPYWMDTNGSKKKKRPMVGILFYNDRYQNDGVDIHRPRHQPGDLGNKPAVEGNGHSHEDQDPEQVPEEEKGIDGRIVVVKEGRAGVSPQGVHHNEQHKPAVEAHMHDPPEDVLFEDTAIKDYIEDKYLAEGNNLDARQRAEDAPEGSEDPCGEGNVGGA